MQTVLLNLSWLLMVFGLAGLLLSVGRPQARVGYFVAAIFAAVVVYAIYSISK